jgi:hypothetical protein
MKSIATELINNIEKEQYELNLMSIKYKKMLDINHDDCEEFNYKELQPLCKLISDMKVQAKQHAETCEIILDEWRDFNKGKDLNKKWTFEEEVLSWCNSEIKILKDGGLI